MAVLHDYIYFGFWTERGVLSDITSSDKTGRETRSNISQEIFTKKKLMIHDSESDITTQQHKDEGHKAEDTITASAGLMLSKLPGEIIHEILLKIPTETLSVCRAVNKAWYCTIKNPSFIKAYNTRVIQNSNFSFVIPQDDALLHFPDRDDAKQTSLTFYTQAPPISEIHSCNSVFLAISKPKDPYFICNPLTGKHMVVPIPIPPGRASNRAITEFGWDPVSQVFKIIRLSDDRTHKLYFGTYLQVYNSGTGQWTLRSWTGREGNREPCRVSSICRFAHRPNTFLNGSLHWLAYPYNGSVSIVSFKLDTEEFQQVPMPGGLDLDPVESRPHFPSLGIGIPRDGRRFPHHLLVLGGCLSLVHNINEHIEIWVMGEYVAVSSWGKKHIISIYGLVLNQGPLNRPYKPIHLMQNGEILLLCSEQNLGYYHPVTKRFRAFDVDDVLYRSSVSQPPLHVGSLIYLAEKP